jgi:hypothetical protein
MWRGTGVSLLPHHDRAYLAEDFATLDPSSRGRAEIGFGGAGSPAEKRRFHGSVSRLAPRASSTRASKTVPRSQPRTSTCSRICGTAARAALQKNERGGDYLTL